MTTPFSVTMMALLIGANLSAREIDPLEYKNYALQQYKIDYNKAPVNIKQQITAEYTKKVNLSEKAQEKLISDSEYRRGCEALALNIWSQRIVQSAQPSEAELRALYGDGKNLKVSPRYKLSHIVLKDDKEADEVIEKLLKKSENERKALMNELAASPERKNFKTDLGWIDIAKLPAQKAALFKDKKAMELIKSTLPKGGVEVILIEELKASSTPTFEEAKPYLLNLYRTKRVQAESEKLLATPPASKPLKK